MDNLNKVNFFCSGGNANITIDNLSIKQVDSIFEKVGIATNSLTFTCDRDNHETQHTYPRTTDPVHNREVGIKVADATSIVLNVGISTVLIIFLTKGHCS